MSSAGFNAQLERGEDVQLSIDIAVQSILREEIQHQIDIFEAVGGAGVVLDIDTGEIVAMVSLPDYDANHLGTAQKMPGSIAPPKAFMSSARSSRFSTQRWPSTAANSRQPT